MSASEPLSLAHLWSRRALQWAIPGGNPGRLGCWRGGAFLGGI